MCNYTTKKRAELYVRGSKCTGAATSSEEMENDRALTGGSALLLKKLREENSSKYRLALRPTPDIFYLW